MENPGNGCGAAPKLCPSAQPEMDNCRVLGGGPAVAMLKSLVLSSLASSLLIASAVTEPAFTQSSPSDRSRPPALVTMEGCLYKEVDVPGPHVPDAVRSRTVTDEDYVLVRSKVIKGSALRPSGPLRQAGRSPTTSSS